MTPTLCKGGELEDSEMEGRGGNGRDPLGHCGLRSRCGLVVARDVASLKLTEGHELWAGRHRVKGRPSAEGGRNDAPMGDTP